MKDPAQKSMESAYVEGRMLMVPNEDPAVSDLDAVICYEFQGDVLYFGPFAVVSLCVSVCLSVFLCLYVCLFPALFCVVRVERTYFVVERLYLFLMSVCS